MASSRVAGEEGAHTQKRLPDLSFPEPGLKGPVVPFAVGEAGWIVRVCVRSATLAASSPKGSAPPKSPLGLGSSPVPERWLMQTPMRSYRLLGPPTLPYSSSYPKKGSSLRALLLRGREERQAVADLWYFPGCKTPARTSALQQHCWGWRLWLHQVAAGARVGN